MGDKAITKAKSNKKNKAIKKAKAKAKAKANVAMRKAKESVAKSRAAASAVAAAKKKKEKKQVSKTKKAKAKAKEELQAERTFERDIFAEAASEEETPVGELIVMPSADLRMKRALSGAAAVPIAGPSASYRRKVQSAVHQAMSKEINRVAQEATSSAVELAQQKNQS